MIRALCLAVISVALSFAQDAPKSIDPEKKAAIIHLLTSMHTTQLMRSQMEMMLPNLIKLMKGNPNISEQFADEFGRRFLAELSNDDLAAIVVQSYADQFSTEEIKSLIVFYDSPIGKKLVEVQPKLLADLGPKMQKYGENLGRTTAEKVLKEHPEYIKNNGGAGAPPQF